MKVGILSQWFDPEPGPAAIPGIFAREFVRAGHQVSVLTGFPNYPSGKIYAGFKQRIRTVGDAEGYKLTRVPVFPSHDSSPFGRMANYASFGITAAAFGRSAFKATDGIWVYNSPITVALPLLIHSNWGHKPYFLQVQDLWPDSLIDSGMFPGGPVGTLAGKVISGVVRLMENFSGVIGVSSPSARELLLRRNPRLDPARIISAPNPTDERLFRPVDLLPRESLPKVSWAGKFSVMYVGAVGDVQGLDSVLGAATVLKPHKDIQLVIVGDGIAKSRLEKQAISDKLNNVTFVGRVEKDLVPGYIGTADVQLVSLAERDFLRYTTPSKIASLLASRVPIIGQLSGDGAKLIEESGAGVLANPGDPGSLADAILWMANLSAIERAQYAARGHRYYVHTQSATVIAGRVVEALSRI